MRFLMCRPDYFGIHYEINPWMSKKIKANHTTAVSQWEKLYQTLKQIATVELVEPKLGWPDMTFTANAGLLFKNKILISHFKHKERQGESAHFLEWFLANGFDVINKAYYTQGAYFEGAGDALTAGKKLFVAYGFRSDRSYYDNESFFKNESLIYCELNDPYFYHIDTCFCPLNETTAIWYPNAFTKDSQKIMEKEITLIPVNKAEARRFACNSVVVDKHVIMPSNCPEISDELNQRGFKIYTCDMSEFLKAGGACKCLTMQLD